MPNDDDEIEVEIEVIYGSEVEHFTRIFIGEYAADAADAFIDDCINQGLEAEVIGGNK